MTSRPLSGLVLCGLLLVAGCGRGWGDVSGRITFQGKPLTKGSITFYDEVNNAVTSPIAADGTYSVSKVAAGKVKVAIVLPIPMFMGNDKQGAAKAAAERRALPKLPARYADPEKSGLDREVKKGQQTIDFDLD